MRTVTEGGSARRVGETGERQRSSIVEAVMDDRLRSAARIATAVVIGVLLLLILAEIRVRMNPDSLAVGGMDFATYRAATMSWLAGGPFYPVSELG